MTEGGSLGNFLRATRRVATLNIVSVASSSLAGFLLASVMSAKTRGAYAGIQSWFWISLVLGELGLTASLTYHSARFKTDWESYLKATQKLLAVCGGVAVLIGLPLTALLARGSTDVGIAYACMFLSVPANMVFGTYVCVLQAQSLEAWNRARLIQPLVYLGFVLFAVGIRRGDLIIAVAILIISSAVQGVASRRLLAGARLASSTAPGTTGEREKIRSLLRYGLASLLGSGPALINTRLDQLVLSLVAPLASLGQYAIAVSISNLALPAVVALGQVALPRLAAGKHESTRSVVVSTMVLAPLVAGAIGIAGWLVSIAVVPPLLGATYSDVPQLVLLLLPGTVGLAAGSALGDVLRGLGYPARAGIAQGIGAVLTVIGLVVLVPLYDAKGAAIVSSIAYCCVWIVETGLLIRLLRFHEPAPGYAEPSMRS